MNNGGGKYYILNFKVESSGQNHSQEGASLSKEEWEGRLLASFARATRGRGLPSPGLMTRLGVPVGGRVRMLRAVEDQ